jgi:hypothetical protein
LTLQRFDIGLEAKDSVAAEMGAIDAQDAAAEGCQPAAIGSDLRPVIVECLG